MKRYASTLIVMILATGATLPSTLTAAEWSGATDDLWGTTGNWAGGDVPDAAGEPASFAGTGAGEVDLNGNSYTIQQVSVTNGTYRFIDSGSGSLTATGSLEVAGGTLTLGDGLVFDASEFALAGGTLKLESTPVLGDGLIELYFDGTWGDSQLDPIDSGSGFLTMTPGFSGTLDVNIDFSGSVMNTRSGGLVGTDTIGACWYGYMRIGAPGPLTAGTISFATSSDDGSVFWVDLDQNGTFDAGELIANNKGGHGVQQRYGTVTLSDGLYKVAIGFYEGSGGEYMGAKYAQGTSTDWATMTFVNPADAGQANLWLIAVSGTTVDYSSLPVRVTADSTLTAIDAGATLGGLTVEDGSTLTIAGEGLAEAVTFSNAVIAAGATAVGFNTGLDTYLTDGDGVDGSSASATITKSGSASLFLDKAASNLPAGAKFDVTAGTLVAVGSATIGSATLELSGGTLALSSPGGNQVYDRALPVDADSVLTAGAHGGGVVGPLTVSLGSVGNDITVSSGTLSVGATDDYTLELRGNQSGNMKITGGSVSLATTATNLGTVTLSGGTLTANNDLTANALIGAGGAFAMSGAYDLAVANSLTVGANMDFSSSSLDVSTATVTINSGATLTDDVPQSAATWNVIGSIAVPSPLTATTKFNFEPQQTVANTLTGSAYLHLGDSDLYNGYVALTASNSYAGRTEIERAVVQADIGWGIPANSRIVFNQNDRDQTAILETSGTFARNIGTADGEVYWINNGGFSAKGGDLTVSLNGDSSVVWANAAGFNGKALQFGSTTADSMVELVNGIDLGTGTRNIQVCNNTATDSDFVRLSGNIVGTSNSQNFRFNENNGNNFFGGLVELTGTNDYSQRTYVDDCTIYALLGAGLSPNSRLYFEGNNDGYESILMSTGSLALAINNANSGSSVYWGDRGGFAARGGPLAVTLNGSPTAIIDWGNTTTSGFNGKKLQMGSRYADDIVELTNPIDLTTGDRYTYIWDNPNTDQDVAKLSGVISGTGSATWFRKYEQGTLWLTGTNTYQQRLLIYRGAVRGIDGVGISSNSWIRLEDTANLPAVIESSGTFTRDINATVTAGDIYWERSGGFAAWGGPLTVNLEGGATLLWGDANVGFRGYNLHLGSRTANDVVTLANNVDGQNGNRSLYVFDNPHSTGDYARATGQWKGFHGFFLYGDGLFVVEDLLQTRQDSNQDRIDVRGDATMKIAEGARLISGQLSTYPTGMQEIFIQDRGTLVVNGSVTSSYVEVQNNAANTKVLGGTGSLWVRDRAYIGAGGVLSPGDDGVGTLTFEFYNDQKNLELDPNATYEWELGATGSDQVDITGDLRLENGWKLKLASAGGAPLADQQYTLFTYTQDFELSPLYQPVLDTSVMPTDWRTNTLTIVNDTTSTPKRIYMTGLYSVLSVANQDVSDIGGTSATANAVLSCEGETLHTRVYWSTNDWGTVATDWIANASNAYVGAFTNEIGKAISGAMTGLSPDTQYFFTFRATNTAATVDLLGQPAVSFFTVGPPAVTLGGGATGIDIGTATLRGQLTAGNSATATLCWGPDDEGTNSPADWPNQADIGVVFEGGSFSNVVSDLLYGIAYDYRVYVTNDAGEAWSSVDTFLTVRPGAPAETMLLWDFYDGAPNSNGWEVLNGATYFRSGDGDGVTPGPGFKGDAAHETFLFESPAFEFTGGTWDGSYAMTWQAAGGPGDQAADGPAHTTPAEVLAFNGGNSKSDGEKGLAFYNQDTLVYDAVLFKTGNGGSPIYNYTTADLTTAGVDLSAVYKLHFYENDDGSWGWGQLNYINLGAGLSLPGVEILNTSAAPGATTALLQGTLDATQSVATVYAYYGPNSNATALAWTSDVDARSVLAGTFTNVMAYGVSATATGLTSDAVYYYTLMIVNEATNIWATPSMPFNTAGLPAVDNAGGATGVGPFDATLNGVLSAGGSADAYIVWGTTNPASLSTGAWQNVDAIGTVSKGVGFSNTVSGLDRSKTYYYRCYVTNAVGQAWSSITNFTTPSAIYVTSFESPVVTGRSTTNPDEWVGAEGYGTGTDGLENEDSGTFTTPDGAQGAAVWGGTRSCLTSAESSFDDVLVAGITYTVTFNVAKPTDLTGYYQVQLLAMDAGDTRDYYDHGTVLTQVTGTSTTNDMSEEVTLTYSTDASNPNIGRLLAIRIMNQTKAVIDNLRFTDNGGGGDVYPPSLWYRYPASGTASLPPDYELRLVFNEEVVAGGGNIVVKKASDDSTVETIAASSGQVLIDSNKVVVTRSVTLDDATAYYVTIDNTAFLDTSANAYPGISGSGGWTFSTPVAEGSNVIFSSSAETPVVSGRVTSAADGWVVSTGYGTGSAGMANTDYGTFVTPFGSQTLAIWNKTRSDIVTTAASFDDTLVSGVVYTVTFNVANGLGLAFPAHLPSLAPAYKVELVAYEAADDRANYDLGTVLASTSGKAPLSDLEAQADGFNYTFVPAHVAHLGKQLAVRVQNEATEMILVDNVKFANNVVGGGDVEPPALWYRYPLANQTTMTVDYPLLMTFSEEVVKGSGNITIRRASDSAIVENIDVTSGQVAVSSNEVTITRAQPFVRGGYYYVTIASTAFVDLATNAYAGISTTNGWAFGTPVPDGPALIYESSFESPVVSGRAEVAPAGWVRSTGYGTGNQGLENTNSGTFATPYGAQAAIIWGNNRSIMNTDSNTINDVLRPGTPYTLSFNVAKNTDLDFGYIVQLVAYEPGEPRDGSTDNPGGSVLATVSGEAYLSDMAAEANAVSFTADATHPDIGKLLGVRIRSRGTIDNLRLTFLPSGTMFRFK